MAQKDPKRTAFHSQGDGWCFDLATADGVVRYKGFASLDMVRSAKRLLEKQVEKGAVLYTRSELKSLGIF